MPHSEKKARRLVVDGGTFLWSFRPGLPAAPGEEQEFCQYLSIRRLGARGRLVIGFRAGPGRFIPDGLVPAGSVGTGGGRLNLYEPGTVRALLDEALAGGRQPDDPVPQRMDGWLHFGPVVARRGLAADAPSA